MTFYYKYPNLIDSRLFPVSWEGDTPVEQKAITDKDIKEIGKLYGITFSHLKAVLEVESRGSGFLLSEPSPARPKILFEAHWFYRLTPKPVSKVRPDLSSRTWNKELYKGGSAEWIRLRDAMAFDEVQALKSASWGLGQIMGFNYALANCESIQDFVVENFTGEREQFMHMIEFIKNTGLLHELIVGDWKAFAAGYNGPGFQSNNYDRLLAAVAKKYR